jgi:hypothetical protein
VCGGVAQFARHGTLLLVKRHEGHDVDDPQSWMYAVVTFERERIHRARDERTHVTLEWFTLVYEGEDRTVVRGVAMTVAQRGARTVREILEDLEISTFGDVKHALEH